MSQVIVPWERLRVLREEIAQMRESLLQKGYEELSLVAECQEWLGLSPINSLTPQELKILNLIQEDPTLVNKELASKLNVTVRTIKFHISHLFVKFGVPNRQKLISMARAKRPIKEREAA